MKKVWLNKRKGVKGWWVGWYEGDRRKAKAFPKKALAEHFRQIKYSQINSEVFTGTVAVGWQQLREEYFHSKHVSELQDSSIYQISVTLSHFERLAVLTQNRRRFSNILTALKSMSPIQKDPHLIKILH